MLDKYNARSGTLEPVWTVEIQTVSEDTDRILDAVLKVHPLGYGRYQRCASISAVGAETGRLQANSTTTNHKLGYVVGGTETYPMVELKISIERDVATLERVMDAVLDAHHYEQPMIYVREDWASRASYDPNNANPYRWWNDGRGMPNQLD
jgi:hypothetical protein